MGKTHILKTWPEPFNAVRKRIKSYEVRVNDRDFHVGDALVLREWCPERKAYIGVLGDVVRTVTYITKGPDFGLPENLVVMSIDRGD